MANSSPSPLAGRRVLIVTLGTRGDVQPFIALCDALKRQGAVPLLATVPHYVGLGAEFNVPVTSISSTRVCILFLRPHF